MSEATRVLGVAGSLRAGSFNRSLLRAAAELVPAGMEIRTFEGLGEIPPYNADVEAAGDPAPVVAWKDAIRNADALLFVTPEYNYGVPGVLKNAFDWASRPAGKSPSPLNRKPAGIMGVSGGNSGTARAQLALRQSFVFTETYGMLRPEVLVPRGAEKFDGDGRLTDERTREAVRKFLEAFGLWVERFRSPKP
ncbi:MAG: NAD(P)H-dependent oxidoreductase [Acidobacteriota bacterium]|nr:NAD(P)H-dependent oxidoreductase [Acidobacteriota bacterium]MDQ5872210.1 NAD(P)H-dependent oxidoreductase [Acidobacteriota bacterium]